MITDGEIRTLMSAYARLDDHGGVAACCEAIEHYGVVRPTVERELRALESTIAGIDPRVPIRLGPSPFGRDPATRIASGDRVRAFGDVGDDAVVYWDEPSDQAACMRRSLCELDAMVVLS